MKVYEHSSAWIKSHLISPQRKDYMSATHCLVWPCSWNMCIIWCLLARHYQIKFNVLIVPHNTKLNTTARFHLQNIYTQSNHTRF